MSKGSVDPKSSPATKHNPSAGVKAPKGMPTHNPSAGVKQPKN